MPPSVADYHLRLFNPPTSCQSGIGFLSPGAMPGQAGRPEGFAPSSIMGCSPHPHVRFSCKQRPANCGGRIRTCTCELIEAHLLPLHYPAMLPVFPGCHSVFIRTLLRYLTLPLRRAPTCHGNGREPDVLTEHHRQGSLQRTCLLSPCMHQTHTCTLVSAESSPSRIRTCNRGIKSRCLTVWRWSQVPVSPGCHGRPDGYCLDHPVSDCTAGLSPLFTAHILGVS